MKMEVNNTINESQVKYFPLFILQDEKNDEGNLTLPIESFKQIINFISKSKTKNVSKDDFNFVAKVMKVSKNNKKLKFLEETYSDVFSDYITEKNVCHVFQLFHNLKDKISKACEKIISDNTKLIISSNDFKLLDITTVKKILEFHRFNVNELNIFSALLEWAENACIQNKIDTTAENQRRVLDGADELIRFGTLNNSQAVELLKMKPDFYSEPNLAIYYYRLENIKYLNIIV